MERGITVISIRDLITELVAAWQAGDALRASAFFSNDGVFAEAGHEPVVGRDAIVSHFTMFFRDGPAFRLIVKDTIAEEHRCAVFYAYELFKNDAWVKKDGVALVTVENGLVSSWKEFY